MCVTLEAGKRAVFSLAYTFYDDTRETELAMYTNGKNLLEFSKNGLTLTTRWNLDDIVEWLSAFVRNMKNDPYPIDVAGEYAAMKDISARNFDTEDDALFDEYYDKLDMWNLRHRWHPASAGAILSDIYFQYNNGTVEISWNNSENDNGVIFSESIGGICVDSKEFQEVIQQFIHDYVEHWF